MRRLTIVLFISLQAQGITWAAYLSIIFIIFFVISFATGPGKRTCHITLMSYFQYNAFYTFIQYVSHAYYFHDPSRGFTSANCSNKTPEVELIRSLLVPIGSLVF